jgi:hypothetical protein
MCLRCSNEATHVYLSHYLTTILTSELNNIIQRAASRCALEASTGGPRHDIFLHFVSLHVIVSSSHFLTSSYCLFVSLRLTFSLPHFISSHFLTSLPHFTSSHFTYFLFVSLLLFVSLPHLISSVGNCCVGKI